MVRRYLFGPVDGRFADQYLHSARERGECLAFGLLGGCDLTINLTDNWADVCSRLPGDWRPDFLALYLSYTPIPFCLWNAPLPIVGLAADWALLWHSYRRCFPACDLVLSDTVGVETMLRAGFNHGRVANIYGCPRAYFESPLPEVERDIDILFVGNFNSAVQRERLHWLSRLSSLAEHWCVHIATGIFGNDYRALLGRSRIVFNRSVAGACNCRAIEATAAGALLFQEAGNPEMASYFEQGVEYVAYGSNDLEELLTYYLQNETHRRAVAEAGHRRAQHYAFADLWKFALNRIDQELLASPWQTRHSVSGEELLLLRTSFLLNCVPGSDPTLAADIQSALNHHPSSAQLHHALAVTRWHSPSKEGPAWPQIIDELHQSFTSNQTNLMACLNLAEVLAEGGQKTSAVEHARRGLMLLQQSPANALGVWDTGHIPTAFDHFRVAWEQEAWMHAGDKAAEAEAKTRLLLWRLHALLATLTGDLAHYYEAAFARPDMPTTRAALGCALARAGKFPEAVPHLQYALNQDPFDAPAARALFSVLGEVGNSKGQRELIRGCRMLALAAPSIVASEPWFTEARPLGDELVSIIILCCNQLEFTKQCLESVLRHTRVPFELLLVDNGSTDRTPAYLEELRHRSGPDRVVVIRNQANRGFAAGCNQGLEAAKGQFFVLLNNDTIVTPHWLDDLVAWSVRDWPKVGLVGPVASWASPPQQVTGSYKTPDDLIAFASKRRKDFAGQAVKVDRLTGFCLLFRRDVWEKIGGLDENYGLGFFEDDDLCVRVRETGFTLLMVPGVFIHHFGNRTFNGLGLDAEAHLQANFEKFRAKWGDDRCAGYRLPESNELEKLPTPREKTKPSVSRAQPSSKSLLEGTRTRIEKSPKATVSLCMIVKNEERHLDACLQSVADLVDEIIIVDTGSTDCTKQIAEKAGARVLDFQWVDSFAAARNESLRHATGQWIFWLDADEELDKNNRLRLRNLLANLKEENVAYVMRQYSKLESATHAAAQVDQVRLFRNRADIRWEYRVHEQILMSVRRSGGEVRLTDVVIDHGGFSDPDVQGPKVERNLRLLELEQIERPDDPFVLYNLGAVKLTQGKSGDALKLFRQSLEHSRPGDVLVRKLHALVTRANHQLGQPGDALEACRAGLQAFPDDGELLFWQAMLLREQHDLNGAATSLEQIFKIKASQHFTSVDAGLHGYRSRHFLAEIYRDQGKLPEAERQWQEALKQAPDFIPARLELAKLFAQGNRWDALNDQLSHLEANPHTAVEALILGARAHLAQREFNAAKTRLRAAINKSPQAVLPRILLSHVLLQEGINWAEAEFALLDILRLDPEHDEAKHNLSVLRRERPELTHSRGATNSTASLLGPGVESSNGDAPKVSLCMIVRNEEHNLGACLESIADLVGEIVVVDTGSNDNTKTIAAQHGAKVIDFPWVDSFAAARNESLKHASGQWVFWLDADDRLDDKNRSKLRDLFAGLKDEIAGYVMKCLCLPDSNGTETVVDHLRLFRNHMQARWSFRVHEQILPALRRLKADIRWSDVVIHHTGYQDALARQRKLQRDLRLLKLEQAEQPDHPFTLFNLGSVYQELGQMAEALKMFQRSLDGSVPTDSIVRKLYALIAQCHRGLGQKKDALDTCKRGLSLFPEDVELLFQEGIAKRESGEVLGAIDCWERCLAIPAGQHFASVNTGLRGHITKHNLATAYYELGRTDRAEELWNGALDERPDYEPAWRALADAYIQHKRWNALEELAQLLQRGLRGELHSTSLRGRFYLAQKDYGAAKRVLEKAIQQWPDALEPRVLLSHTLLQEGKDWPGAERALRAILRIQPQHAEASHNLKVLSQQKARGQVVHGE